MKTAKLLTIFFVLVALMLTAKAALGADTDIKINEIMVDPSTGDQWVELYNPDSSSVNYNVLGNGVIKTGNGDTPITGKILAGDYLIVELDFPATNTGDRFVLKNSPSGFIDALTFGNYTNVNIPEHVDDVPEEDDVLARIHDGEDWSEEAHPEDTKDAANNRLPEGEVPVQELVETVQKTIDLSQHFEDLDEDSLTYTNILGKEENAICNINGNELEIIATGKDPGYCQIKVKDGYGYVNKFVEFSVTPALEVVSLYVNGDNVAEGEETPELFPLSQVTAELTVKNNLDYTIFNVNSFLNFSEFTLEGDQMFNIDSGATKIVYATGEVPADAAFGVYASDLMITGTSLYLESVGDDLSFNTVIYQESSELVITDLTLNHDTLTCKDKTTLTVDLINTGINNINDAVATVKVGGEEYTKIFTIASGNTIIVNFGIFAEDLSQGSNQILVEVPYGIPEYISINKGECISDWLPKQAEDEVFVSSTAVDEISMEISEEEYAEETVWYVNGEECTINSCNYGTVYGTEFDFSASGEGEFEVYGSLGGEATQT